MNDCCNTDTTRATAIEPTKETARPRERSNWTYRPDVNIEDTGDALRLLVDVPGAAPSDIDVVFEDGIVSIQANVTPRRPGARLVRQEYGIGAFHRRFKVDESIDAEHIAAEHRNGTLVLTLPRTQRAARRTIEITG